MAGRGDKTPTGSHDEDGLQRQRPHPETQVVALKDNDLDGLFGGKDDYKIADDAASLDRAQDTRAGSATSSSRWLMFLILALVTAENLLANKFHKVTPKA